MVSLQSYEVEEHNVQAHGNKTKGIPGYLALGTLFNLFIPYFLVRKIGTRVPTSYECYEN